MHKALAVAAGLSNIELLSRVTLLASSEREATVELVAHLAQVEVRKLHLREGYGSLFAYCTGALRLAEHAAYNRIEAARLARRFPAVLDLLAEGALNLSTARLLAPHLRPDNVETVVAQARGRSKREVEVLVARLAPKPDVAASVRRLPTPSRPRWAAVETGLAVGQSVVGQSVIGQPVVAEPVVAEPVVAEPVVAEPVVDGPVAGGLGAELPAPAPSSAALVTTVVPAAVTSATRERPMPRAEVTPLAPERYSVRFTIDAATREKLVRVQDLLRREIPNGDPGAIFGRALDLLLEDVARRKLATVEKPRPQSGTGGRGRNIPSAVKRAVWARDRGRCAFVSAKGRRCSERAFLEFHHREPYAMGGAATPANISLRCGAHNRYEAELDFGRRSNSSRGEFAAPVPGGESIEGSPSRTGPFAVLASGP